MSNKEKQVVVLCQKNKLCDCDGNCTAYIRDGMWLKDTPIGEVPLCHTVSGLWRNESQDITGIYAFSQISAECLFDLTARIADTLTPLLRKSIVVIEKVNQIRYNKKS